MDEHQIVRVQTFRHDNPKTRTYINRITIHCTCGWMSERTQRPRAQTEFLEHQSPYLTLDELIEKYATPPYMTPLADLMDRYGKGEDPP